MQEECCPNMRAAREVEAYAKTSDPDAVVLLLSEAIGPLVTEGSSEQGPRFYEFNDIAVVLQASEDGFLSVWVRGSSALPSSP